MGKLVFGAWAGAAVAGCVIASCSYSTEADPKTSGNDGGARDAGPGADGATFDSDSGGPGGLAECPAQRVVHLVGGNGGFAWFTQVWPLPEVITNGAAAYAYDDTKLASNVASSSTHTLFARNVGGKALWTASGQRPMPTVFVAGINMTHTATPNTTRIGSVDVIAAGATLQKKLGAPVPVIRIGRAYVYGPAPLAPVAVDATDTDAAATAIAKQLDLPPSVADSLRPNATVVAQWTGANARAGLTNLARGLLFAANAFRLNLVSTIIMPAFEDDPHGAFQGGGPTSETNATAQVLDAFYRELQKSNEATCGHLGKPLPLADNVLFLASGDTYKNPFERNGWADATPENTNLLYVRSNGFLQPGWFGQVRPSGVLHFDPASGAATAAATQPEATSAALQGVLYAIARGDGGAVRDALPLVSTPYQGVIEPSPP